MTSCENWYIAQKYHPRLKGCFFIKANVSYKDVSTQYVLFHIGYLTDNIEYFISEMALLLKRVLNRVLYVNYVGLAIDSFLGFGAFGGSASSFMAERRPGGEKHGSKVA